MPKKNSRNHHRKLKQRKSNTATYVIIAAIVVVIITAVAAFALLSNASATISQKSTTDPRLVYLTVQPENPVLGSQNASVTIFEFGDFQCPSCDQWFRTVEPQIIQNLINTDKAKFVWRDFDYYGPDSTYASQAAYAASEQGNFWQYHNILYSNQGTPNSGWASPANLQKFAQSLNLNMAEFSQVFNSTKYSSLIKSNYNAGQNLGVQGTPTFFVVGPTGSIVTISGGQPYSVFASAVISVTS